jgi:CDP-diacylglycerol--glycerol-3-phosphate 3-phosphatidyltransferase
MATMTSPHPPVLNVPNLLTASRLLLSIVLFVLIDQEAWLACLIIFAIAAVTDWLDGYLARLQGLSSALGRVFDPLVDKVLICGAYIFLLEPAFASQTGLAPWMVTVVVARELIINGLRTFLESRGVRFGADWLGKIKMGLQCAALIAIFMVLYVQGASAETRDFVERQYREAWSYHDWILWVFAETRWYLERTRDGLIYGMIAATALSGLQYVVRAVLILNPRKEP